jgi:hypothetical protein
MKIIGAIGTTILFLFFVASTPVFSQEREESKPDEAKPAHQQEEKDKAKAEEKAKHEEGKHQEEQPGARQDEHRGQPEATREEKKEQKEQRPEQRMERGNQQRPVHAQGKHIPDDKFRAHFGRQHTFHVQRTQIINNPQPVIVYGGYSFELIEPWPAEWAFDDDCYIDYVDDEYFLFDVFHPGIRIAVFVVG